MIKSVASLVLGGLVGAGLAVLLAPRSGAETRRVLQRQTNGLREQYEDVIAHGRMRAREMVKSGREAIQSGREKIEDSLEPRIEDPSH